jgi:ornithine cyclodeaminase
MPPYPPGPLSLVPFVSVQPITLFDSVGFATEDFPALRYVHDRIKHMAHFISLDLIADPDEPRDLYGMILRAAA